MPKLQIMICFIRLWHPKISIEKENHIREKFHFKESKTQDNINYEANYNGLILTLYRGGLFEVSGSLHNHFNEGLHNYNDFSRLDLFDTVSCLCLELDIAPDEFTIHGIEFGVNIHVDIPPKVLMNRILSKGKCKIKSITGGYHLKASQWYLKVYDKTPKSEKDYKIRVEVHVNSMQWLKKRVEIDTLSSLMKVETLDTLGKILFKEFDQVIFWENFRQFALSKTELRFIDNLPLKGEWGNLKPYVRKRKIDSYNKLLGKYFNENSLSYVLSKGIKSKWYELLQRPSLKKCNDFNGVQDGGQSEICNELKEEFKDAELVESVMDLTLVLNSKNITVKRRRRKITLKNKCSNCRKVLNHAGSYCDIHCKKDKSIRNKRNKAVKKVLSSVRNQGNLFGENEGLKLSEKERRFLGETLNIARRRLGL